MSKLLVTALAASISMYASAQTSSATVPATDSAATSSVSATETAKAPKSKWSGGVMVLAEKDAINKDTNIRGKDEDGRAITSDNFDNDGASLATQTHLSVGYKLDNGDSIKVTQRFFYSQALLSSRQDYNYNWDPGSLRVGYNTSGKMLGADGGLTVRTGLPTTQGGYTSSYLGQVAVIPSLNWELNPKWSISYSGFAAATLYHGKDNTPLSKYDSDAFRNGTDTQADWNSRHSRGGAQRSFLTVSNAVAVGYNISDTVSFSQSVGQNFGVKNFNYLKRFTQGWDLSTSLAWQARANIGLELGVSQGIADMPGSMDPTTEKPLYFDNYNVGLFRPEQTTYSLSTNVTF